MSESYKLIILPQAQQDMREISIYIAKELLAPQAALRLLDVFHETIRSLEHMPKMTFDRVHGICYNNEVGPAFVQYHRERNLSETYYGEWTGAKAGKAK